MTTSRPWYATRGMVIHALDTTPTPRLAAAIDRALTAASTIVDERAGGKFFYPWWSTRSWDWPDAEAYTGRRLHLWSVPLTQVTAITVAGTVLAAGSYHLRPVSGPPYDTVLLDQDTLPGYWSTSPTTGVEDAVTIEGLWGHGADKTIPAGALTAAGITDSATTLLLGAVSQPLRVDVGGILEIEDEIVLVTEASWVDTTIDVGVGGLAASVQATVLPVTSTTGLSPGQWIIVGGEKLLIVDILGAASLLVARAQHGTVLASHAGGDAVLAPWSLTVERGVLGTTAVAHAASTPVSAHTPPGLVEQATIASAIAQVLDQTAGYASPAGPSGGAQKAGVTGAGAGYLLDLVTSTYALSTRRGAI
jgi:hypothetical protein